MAWNSVWPNGSQSVKDNQPTGAANTTYTETTMNVDHYWNISGTNDGHHKFVQMISAVNDAAAALATGMNGNVYCRSKTSAESPSHQNVEFYGVNVELVMQLLGIKSCGVMDLAGTVGTQNYFHNSIISRSSVGLFTVTFNGLNLGTNKYLVFGGCVGGGVYWKLLDSNDLTLKTATGFSFETRKYSDDLVKDPVQVWYVVFGG